jgi:S-adenosylmethionine uptake transporter
VFTAIFAVLLLGERLDLRIASALAAGFAGVLVIVLGGAEGRIGGGSVLGVAAILLSSVTYAASNVLLRARAQRDPLLLIVLVQNIAPAAMLAIPAALMWRSLEGRQILLMLVIGSLGVAGHLLLARAYAAVEAVRLAPIDYTALLWAVLIGFAVFGEVPTVWAALGAILILAGAAAATRRRPPERALPGSAETD